MSRFNGKVAIVTGGGSGIGAGIARRLVDEGASVMLAARTKSKLAEVAASTSAPERVAWHVTDVAEEDQVAAMVAATAERFGAIHAVVNNAGTGGLSRVVDTPTADWMKIFAIDLHSAFFVCRAAIPYIIAAGGGAVVNVSSTSGMAADAGFGAYNAAKAGLINLTRTLALECVNHNIRVNCISPGFVETPSSSLLPESYAQEVCARIPMGRYGNPAELAAAVAFLLSDDASFITGENLVADGGMRASSHNPSFLKIFEEGWTGNLVASNASESHD